MELRFVLVKGWWICSQGRSRIKKSCPGFTSISSSLSVRKDVKFYTSGIKSYQCQVFQPDFGMMDSPRLKSPPMFILRLYLRIQSQHTTQRDAWSQDVETESSAIKVYERTSPSRKGNGDAIKQPHTSGWFDYGVTTRVTSLVIVRL